MRAAWLAGMGLAVCGLAGFLLSLLHVSLNAISKIAFSGILEDRKKEFRQRMIDRFDDLRIAVEILRILSILASGLLLFFVFRRGRFWPAGPMLTALAGYLLIFEYVPRLINALSRGRLLGSILPVLGPLLALSSPLTFLSRRLQERGEEEKVEADEPREAATEDAIETFLDEAQEEGIIEKEEEGLLRGVVEFGGTLVREIMTPRVKMVCIRKDTTIGRLRELIIKEQYSRIPVYKDRIDNIEGIVIAKDLLEYADPSHKNLPIEGLLRPVIFVPESMEVSALLKEFKRAKVKLAIVVDEHGGVSGLVTMEDLVEEIVGEIQDEYDLEEPRIVENGPRDFTLSGEVEVEELEDRFERDLAEDDFLTAGGLVTHHLGRLPRKGETVVIKGLSFEVLDVDPKRVKKLRVRESAGGQDGSRP
jgi:CBS domain containing-hemolysin-like protein